MIIGIGVDIVEISRIELAIKRNKLFLEKLFTEQELKFFKLKGYRAETIAGRFAGKEAVAKAMGTGFRGFSMKDIEILSDELGKPQVIIKNKARKVMGIHGHCIIHISISHSRDNAISYVILEGEKYDNRNL